MALWGLTDAFADVPSYLQPTVTFDGTAVATGNDITLTAHSFENGDEVLYTSTAAITGLVSGTAYFVVGRTADTIQLAATSGGAAIGLTTGAGATDDSLQKVAEPPCVFVDTAEASVSENRDRGVKTAGWNQFRTWTVDGGATTRYAVEPIVAAAVTATAAGDQADDTIAADATLTIDTQPLAASVTAPDPATFTVVASTNADNAVITFQWQVDDQLGGGFVDVTDETSASLTIADSTGLNLYEYRVVVTADVNGEILTATSNAVALTVA